MSNENLSGVPVDDGHTIADMSALVGRSETADKPFANELQDAEERWAVILGTVKAALSIWAVYIIAFGIIIAVLIWLWT